MELPLLSHVVPNGLPLLLAAKRLPSPTWMQSFVAMTCDKEYAGPMTVAVHAACAFAATCLGLMSWSSLETIPGRYGLLSRR